MTIDISQIELPKGITLTEETILSPKEYRANIKQISFKEVKQCRECDWTSWTKVDGCSQSGCSSEDFKQWTKKDREEWIKERALVPDCDCPICQAEPEGTRKFSCSFGFPMNYKG